MSLLVPDKRDHQDAHADLDQDKKYHFHLSQTTPKWLFEPVDGFFLQSAAETDDMEFRYTLQDFGAAQPWSHLIKRLDELNSQSESGVRYKLLFLARHGQGWHNVVTKKYSKADWFSKWRYLGTDGDLVWGPDAKLTQLGIDQARENHQAWKLQLSKGCPMPDKFYVSPLSRSINTHNITWPDTNPVVIDKLRETIGVHLCHKRSTKTEISEMFPNVEFEPGFAEEDVLFDKVFSSIREELHQQFLRIHGVLSDLFDDDDSVISITSHAGTIRSFITVIGHRKFTIPTGGMIPIVVKGVKQ
ncbi:phosphomutase-like protein [Spathaspora passalidarum NRRL Y-27907]|uniref:Phosphomutase-like protein n=1 Tax=Spathaspora passalidarum (strain NRRL Y-27907 / 11-Y1) TaxID=619300 RepID=G3AIF8_SPAPN|nr:phosphomutase-like protein [Spathaspora passalidarum NRRL Y-27907]EGW34428.1 phosphomutase-like protein [Spathaspora passalidarum NRRL Y-27907]